MAGEVPESPTIVTDSQDHTPYYPLSLLSLLSLTLVTEHRLLRYEEQFSKADRKWGTSVIEKSCFVQFPLQPR